jgi:hypothetical protein
MVSGATTVVEVVEHEFNKNAAPAKKPSNTSAANVRFGFNAEPKLFRRKKSISRPKITG